VPRAVSGVLPALLAFGAAFAGVALPASAVVAGGAAAGDDVAVVEGAGGGAGRAPEACAHAEAETRVHSAQMDPVKNRFIVGSPVAAFQGPASALGWLQMRVSRAGIVTVDVDGVFVKSSVNPAGMSVLVRSVSLRLMPT
jgi:hypothetical protein